MLRLIAPNGEESGFSVVEMLLLIAVLVVSLVGVVALMGKSVSNFSAGGGTKLYEEGTRLLDRIEALVSGARVIALAYPDRGPSAATGFLEFAADLDGSGGHVSEKGSALEIYGMERVGIDRASARKLVAHVLGESCEASEVVLSSSLDPRDPRAFEVRYTAQGDRVLDIAETNVKELKIRALRVSIKLRAHGEARGFTRVIHLNSPAFVSGSRAAGF